MRRSIALVAAILTVGLGLVASLPAQAGDYGRHDGFRRGYGPSHGYGHGYSQGYGHGYGKPYAYGRHGRGYSDSTLLAAVGIIAGAKIAGAYLQGPPVYQSTVVYAAPVQPRTCYQVMVPYASPYGGYTYVPQLQCY